ncbi:LacI family DNA-binding transcriptional regulator [Sphingomonas psychrotolerans]|uniref:LacI family DNA-binding transcriptional regulator n=1 Tax=Sphingomonas psychrotolerans TaxID=1327635 RepID=A0ABU3N8T4_9SPHN|nr:LacI family DNA-binding transcriptional regulator [Sphingomonas psychrotolerans]MDT8760909.1 LacI family DNA-binding transcriptional regulator [Sphingomonas psychrotolerans]
MRAKRATLKSIASELGVTPTSVSNAYNNPAKVSKALRERIIAYARTVNFEGPNPAARSLRTGRCGAIGVLFNDQLSYAFTDAHDITFLRGISSVCEEEGANLVLIPLQNKHPEQRDSLSAIVDGYILNAPYKSHPTIRHALARGLPTVVVDFDAPELASVQTNDREMMRAVAGHLLALGHRELAIITFPRSAGNGEIVSLDRDFADENYVVHERIAGCRDAFAAAGIATHGVLVCETPNSEEGGSRAAERLLRQRPVLTALVCFSDRLARGAIARCEAQGLNVPGHVSVTGFDGLDPPGHQPGALRLTTVRQNAFEKGRKAAEILLRARGEGPLKVGIEAEFVVGDSSATAWRSPSA